MMNGEVQNYLPKKPKIFFKKKLQPLKFTHHQKGLNLSKKSQIRVTNVSTPFSLWMQSHRVATNYKKTHFQGGWGGGGDY